MENVLVVTQRWNFIFESPKGERKVGSAQPLINTVNGIIKPFTVLDSSIDDGQIIYRLIPDYPDDPELDNELMPEVINGKLEKFVIIIEEVTI